MQVINKLVRLVKTVAMHIDSDEAMAWWLTKKFGGHLFSIDPDVKFEFRSIQERLGAEHWAKLETLVIGSGGDVYDEHVSGERAREEKQCSSTKAARHLGITDPTILRIAEEVCRYDYGTGCPKTHLGTLLKIFRNKNRATGKGSDDITSMTALKWALQVIDVVYGATANPEGKELKNQMPPFGEFVDRLINDDLSNEFTDDDALCGLRRAIADDRGKADTLTLENIFRCLWQTSEETQARKIGEDIKDHILFALSLIYWDQQSFHSFKREMLAVQNTPTSPFFRVNGWCEGRAFQIMVAAVRTPNRHAHSVLRSMKAQVTVVEDENGHVTIMGDKRAIGFIDEGFVSMAAMLRYSELDDAKRGLSSWSLLSVRGSCPTTPEWYLGDVGWLLIANGTDNFKDVPKTKLTLQQIIRICRDAFNPNNVRIWKEKNRVPADRAQEALRETAVSLREGPNGLDSLGRVMDAARKS